MAGILLQTGLLPPGSASGGDRGVRLAGAVRVRAAVGRPPPSGPPGRSPTGAVTGDVKLTAQGIAFVETTIAGPADKPFTIAFDNRTRACPTTSRSRTRSGADVWRGDVIPGVETRVYDVPALPAGTYTFVCTIHANMTGTATLQ